MARTHHVQAAKKAQGNCQSPDCKRENRAIEPGMSYVWFSIRSHKGGRGQRRVYHPECRIPASHRTTSVQLGIIYDAQDDAQRAMADMSASCTADELQAVADAFASSVREAGEMYVESADNMESGFGHETSMSGELREKGEMISSWADDVEQGDWEEFDEEAALMEAREQAEDGDADEIDSLVEDARQEWWDEQQQKLQDLIDQSPL